MMIILGKLHSYSKALPLLPPVTTNTNFKSLNVTDLSHSPSLRFTRANIGGNLNWYGSANHLYLSFIIYIYRTFRKNFSKRVKSVVYLE